MRAFIDQSLPSQNEWPRSSEDPGQPGSEAGVTFAMSVDSRRSRTPPPARAYAVLLGNDRVRLVQITFEPHRNSSLDTYYKIHQLAEVAVAAPKGSRRVLEVKVRPGTVLASLDGRRVASFPWKPEGDGEGFAGFIFNGIGYASLAQPSINEEGADR